MMKTMTEGTQTIMTETMNRKDIVVNRLKKADITRLTVTYRDSAKGTGVIEYNNGVFYRFIMIDGDPQLSKLEKVPFGHVMLILDLIRKGRYTAISYLMFNNRSVVEMGWA
ncbi:hypothetical protein H0266_18345 [Halobacillus locisalis]|uniref:Uncharacterized protein n=1 Tax=Halobacillus locisalis TaxID=220753 RepID=A0A838CY28_9BACI|nr:hypothetical protein [Halobacillus locisalis]MBA2176843.1 hypothetical protein [Halobacillus locisalis]